MAKEQSEEMMMMDIIREGRNEMKSSSYKLLLD
jgi:hypothetical protein